MKLNPLSPRWQHDDPEVRLRSVASGKLDQDILEKLSLNDSALPVRVAATALLNNLELLIELSTDQVPDVAEAAAERWATHLGEDLSNLHRINEALPEALLIHIAIQAGPLDMRRRAVELLPRQENLETVLQRANHTRVHQHAALLLEEETLLTRLQQHFLDKDKNVLRIIRSKVQAIKLAREREQAALNRVIEVVSGIDLLTRGVIPDDFERRYRMFLRQWDELAEQQVSTSAEQRASFEASRAGCEQILQQRIKDASEPAPEAPPSEPEAPPALSTEALTTLFSEVQQLTADLQNSAENLPGLSEKLDAYTEQLEHTTPPPEMTAALADLSSLASTFATWSAVNRGRSQRSLDKFASALDQLSWPPGFAEPPELKQVQAEIDAKLADREERHARAQTLQTSMDEQLTKLEQEIEAGHLKAALKAQASINKLLDGQDVPGRLANRWNALQKRLRELQDWQGFATLPKREELCEQMQQLAADVSIAPLEKADAIKDLQDQWKKLGPSTGREAQRLWQRFKEAGDTAYEPCAAYFAEQQARREQHLAEREKVITALEVFLNEYDWGAADWREVQNRLNQTRQAWRQHSDIPRNRRRAIERRFDKHFGELKQRLHDEQERNHDIKQAYIADVVRLQEEADLATRIAATKKIQAQWKEVGITDKRKDQKLWKAFRSECDKVFAARNAAQDEAKAAVDTLAASARQMITTFRNTMEESSTLNQQEINRFRKQFSELKLPAALSQIARESDKAIKQARDLLRKQAHENERLMFAEFQRLANLCDQRDAGEIDAATLAAQWESDISLEAGLRERINHRKSSPPSRDADSLERLLIQLEILAGIDSPEESQRARMALQVERLNRELSRGEKETRTRDEQANSLVVDWYCEPGKTPSEFKRFATASAKLGFA